MAQKIKWTKKSGDLFSHRDVLSMVEAINEHADELDGIDSEKLLPKSIIAEDDGLYQVRNGTIYPVSHPPLSTQPSILPQSFGLNDIFEVLIADGSADAIPMDAVVMEASSFNSNACVPAIVEKKNGQWTIRNNEGVTPDFTLVRYMIERNAYYYEEG